MLKCKLHLHATGDIWRNNLSSPGDHPAAEAEVEATEAAGMIPRRRPMSRLARPLVLADEDCTVRR